MNKYLQLFRLGNAVMGIVGLTVASFMAVGTDVVNHGLDLVISAVIVFLFIAGGNSLNDYIDADIDRTAHPERPVPSGRMTPIEARNIGIVTMALSVVASFFTFDPACIAIVIVAAVLMVSYELFLKQRGFVGNVTIAVLTGMLFLLGGAVVGDLEGNMIVALMACLVSIGREISKDIEDMDSDEGRNTLPMRIGVRNSAILASFFFVIGPVLSVLPMVWHSYGLLYYFVVVADLMFLYCSVVVHRDAHAAQSIAKKAMMVALVAFILGVIPI